MMLAFLIAWAAGELTDSVFISLLVFWCLS